MSSFVFSLLCAFWLFVFSSKSTDTGDYLPEGYVEPDFSEGMLGSQAGLSSAQRAGGPELPGMEHLGEDSVMMGGIELAEGIPADMEFIPASVPDGNYEMSMPITTTGEFIISTTCGLY